MKEFSGKSMMYLSLQPTTDSGTCIYAPLDSMNKMGLRRVISSQAADQLLKALSQTPATWIADHVQRKKAFESTLRAGDLLSIAKMVKDLLTQNADSKLNISDKDFLPRAEKKLFSEIALAKDICFDSAGSLVQQAI